MTDIQGAYQRLSADEQFADAGMRLVREPVDGALSWQIEVSALELDDPLRERLRQFARGEGLDFVEDAQSGAAVIRLLPETT